MDGFLRKAVESYIRGDGGAGAGTVLRPLSRLYETAVRTRLGLYRAGLLKTRSLPCKVISVGNITAGGSGKTPLAIYIADYLKDMGTKVVILSRGYGGSLKGIGVVSDGKDVFLGPAEAGDEPVLMARRLVGVPVLVGADRFSAGQLAVERFSPDVIILDDGYQHIRLHRDLNILLVDGTRELGAARLLPAGPLREPLTGLKRAHMVLVKGGRLNDRDKKLMRKYDIIESGFVFKARGLTDLTTGETVALKALKGKPLLALAAIADPSSFFTTLKDVGLKVTGTMAYRDHHPYTAADLNAMKDKMKESGAAALITTAKDGVKLANLLQGTAVPSYTLDINLEIKDKASFKRAMAPFTKGAKGTRDKERRP